MAHEFRQLIFLQVMRGEAFADIASVIDCGMTSHRDVIDVTGFDPVMRNPERTPLSVVMHWLMLKRPPPKFVPDAARVGKQEFMAGLITAELTGGLRALDRDDVNALEPVWVAMSARDVVRVRCEIVDEFGFEYGTVYAVNLILMALHEERDDDGRRQFSFTGRLIGEPEVSPNQPEDAQ